MFVYRDAKGKITDVLGSVNVADLENLKKGKPTTAEVVEVAPVEEEASEAEAEEEPEPEEEPPDEVEVPKVSDPKAVWVDFAVSQGQDRDDAESWTKQELIDTYGG